MNTLCMYVCMYTHNYEEHNLWVGHPQPFKVGQKMSSYIREVVWCHVYGSCNSSIEDFKRRKLSGQHDCTKCKWQAQVQCCSEGNDYTHTHTHTHTHTTHTLIVCMYIQYMEYVCTHTHTHTNRPHMKPVAYSNHAHTYMRMYTRTCSYTSYT